MWIKVTPLRKVGHELGYRSFFDLLQRGQRQMQFRVPAVDPAQNMVESRLDLDPGRVERFENVCQPCEREQNVRTTPTGNRREPCFCESAFHLTRTTALIRNCD